MYYNNYSSIKLKNKYSRGIHSVKPVIKSETIEVHPHFKPQYPPTSISSCHSLIGCSPFEYLGCSVFQKNSRCWLKKKGCLCLNEKNLLCPDCRIYKIHYQEVLVLLEKARMNDKQAFDAITKEYSSFIFAIANKFFLPGGTPEDIFQEGLIGLFEAVRKYDPELSNSFEKYASFCIRNSILAALKKATQKRQRALNESTSIQEKSIENSKINPLVDENFESSLILKIILESFMSNSAGSISAVEYKVLSAKISGFSNDEIKDMFHLTKKQMENAIYRARMKLKEILTAGL